MTYISWNFRRGWPALPAYTADLQRFNVERRVYFGPAEPTKTQPEPSKLQLGGKPVILSSAPTLGVSKRAVSYLFRVNASGPTTARRGTNSLLIELPVVPVVREQVRRQQVHVETAFGPFAEPSGRGQVHVFEASYGPTLVSDLVFVLAVFEGRIRADGHGQHQKRDLYDQQPDHCAVRCRCGLFHAGRLSERVPPEREKATKFPLENFRRGRFRSRRAVGFGDVWKSTLPKTRRLNTYGEVMEMS